MQNSLHTQLVLQDISRAGTKLPFQTSTTADLTGLIWRVSENPPRVEGVRDFFVRSFPLLLLRVPVPRALTLPRVRGANLVPQGGHWRSQRPRGVVRGVLGTERQQPPSQGMMLAMPMPGPVGGHVGTEQVVQSGAGGGNGLRWAQ